MTSIYLFQSFALTVFSYYWIIIGLIKKKDMMLVETTSVWQNLKKAMRLIDDRINMSRPDDISYVSAGLPSL